MPHQSTMKSISEPLTTTFPLMIMNEYPPNSSTPVLSSWTCGCQAPVRASGTGPPGGQLGERSYSGVNAESGGFQGTSACAADGETDGTGCPFREGTVWVWR